MLANMTDEKRPHIEIGEASPWWLRRVQDDADIIESVLGEVERANRGPQALGGLSRELRKVAGRQPGVERLSRDRVYGALVLLALEGRIRIYGDRADLTRNTTFQVQSDEASARHPDESLSRLPVDRSGNGPARIR
jgi:hypothetical protein